MGTDVRICRQGWTQGAAQSRRVCGGSAPPAGPPAAGGPGLDSVCVFRRRPYERAPCLCRRADRAEKAEIILWRKHAKWPQNFISAESISSGVSPFGCFPYMSESASFCIPASASAPEFRCRRPGAWTYAPYVETPEDRLFTEAELAEAAFADERCVRCRNFFASQLLDRELRADPEFYIHPTLLGRYMNIWVGRCDLRCLTSRLGTLNPFCAYYTDRDPSKPADAASLRAALSRFELCCESDGSGAVRRLRGGSNAVSLLELPALFPERETLGVAAAVRSLRRIRLSPQRGRCAVFGR